jgi:hypothetical membrane protein
MTETAGLTGAAGPRLALTRSKTRLASLIGGLSMVAGAAYITLYLALLHPDAAILATASGLATLLVPLACALPALAVLFSYRRLPEINPDISASEREYAWDWLAWLNRLTGAAITGALSGWVVWLLCILLVPLFPDTSVAVPALIAGCALFGGLAGAVTAYASTSMDRRSFLVRLCAMLGLGLLLCMMLVADPSWWRDSLSYMGRSGPARWVFDITMILAGLGLCGVMLEIGRGLRGLSQQGLFPTRAARALTWLLAIGSLSLVGVGLFPSNTEPVSLALHKLSSNGGLLIFLSVMLALRWLAPPFGKTAHLASAIAGGLIMIDFFWYTLNIFNFVWFELTYIALLVTWLFFFESYSRAVLGDHYPVF